MVNLEIDYELKTSEIITFPFVPAYGIRHLRKEGWQNKVIGAVELFPVLGPIVALIERAVVAIFQAQQKLSQVKNLKKRICDQIKKTKEFNESALANLKKTQNSQIQETIPAELNLTKEQEQTLTVAVAELQKYQIPNNVKVHGKNGIWVFSIEEIPDMIFKTTQSCCSIEADFSKRIEDTQKAKSIIDSEKLHLLHAPKQKIQSVEIDGKKLKVLIEQKFDIIHGYRKQRNIFQYCINNIELQPFIQECARQLVILISKTGYRDVRYDNNPILTNGMGLALIDFDTSTYPVTGLKSGCAKTGDDGILQCLTPKMIDEFEPLLNDLLTSEQLEKLKLSEIREENQKAADRNPRFAEYLAKRNILTARENVRLQGWTPLNTPDTQFRKKLEQRVNEIASQNLGICPVDERKFYIYESVKEKLLNKLKEQNKIFDWVKLPTYGFYVWC